MTDERIKEDLKPCPFCGQEAYVKNFSALSGSPAWVVFCQTKPCFGHSSSQAFATKERAAEAWNTRAGA